MRCKVLEAHLYSVCVCPKSCSILMTFYNFSSNFAFRSLGQTKYGGFGSHHAKRTIQSKFSVNPVELK